jgi:excisionase family DNA binding protein
MENYGEEKEWYTTGEAAKILGVSFRTIKRWIYSGKISATRTVGGHYRISKDVIKRLRSEVEDQFAVDVVTFIDQKRIAYFREVQLNMEDKYRHYETRDKLEWLVRQRKINTKYELGRDGIFH